MSESQNTNNQDMDRHSEYIELLMGNLNEIYRYIVTLVPNAADAEDILQETSVLIWQKFDTYQTGSNFKNWALTISRYLVLNYYRKKKNEKVKFSSQTISAISDFMEQHKADNERDIEVLNKCLSKLKEKDRDLIKLKYSQQITTKQLAIQFGRSITGLYSSLARIHRLLIDCVKRSLASGDV